MSEIVKKSSRFGGECYIISCPFHYSHVKGEEPLCNAESIELTEAEFQSKAVCKQEEERS